MDAHSFTRMFMRNVPRMQIFVGYPYPCTSVYIRASSCLASPDGHGRSISEVRGGHAPSIGGGLGKALPSSLGVVRAPGSGLEFAYRPPKPQPMDMKYHTNQLKDLHELITDCRKGYEEAAKQVDSPPLRQFLQRLSAQRTSMQAELAAEVHRFNPDEELQDGTAK